MVKIDIDKSPALAQQLRIQSVPTFMVFAEQRIADAKVGALGKKQLRAMVEPFFPRAAGAIKARELAQLIKRARSRGGHARRRRLRPRPHPRREPHAARPDEARLAELYMMADRPVLYGRSGDKTKELAARMAEQGTPVAYVEGGFLAWEAEGLPVERP